MKLAMIVFVFCMAAAGSASAQFYQPYNAAQTQTQMPPPRGIPNLIQTPSMPPVYTVNPTGPNSWSITNITPQTPSPMWGAPGYR